MPRSTNRACAPGAATGSSTTSGHGVSSSSSHSRAIALVNCSAANYANYSDRCPLASLAMDLAWLTLLALLVVVVVSCTTRVNPGVVAIVLAWAIVALAGPWFSASPGLKALWTAFPGELFLTLLGVSLLFSQAETNGTLARVAHIAQGLCGGNAGLLPILFF